MRNKDEYVVDIISPYDNLLIMKAILKSRGGDESTEVASPPPVMFYMSPVDHFRLTHVFKGVAYYRYVNAGEKFTHEVSQG